MSYDWQEAVREARYYPGRQIGVLGQEMEAVFPELVGTDSQGDKFVRYQKLVAPPILPFSTPPTPNQTLTIFCKDLFGTVLVSVERQARP